MTTKIELKNISKYYGDTCAVTDLSLALRTGDIGCLLGPSGCGKTSVLRMIAGFERLNKGTISINGKLISSIDKMTPPEKRNIGMVFQDYALFPHLTVMENIEFGIRKADRVQNQGWIKQLTELVGLEAVIQKYPHELSGGQQQRVALARALAPKPDLLLMDEPFSNLDVSLREKLSMEVRDILKISGTTALMVTHNQLEAFSMADVIGVMASGKMEQWDTAHNLYHRPTTPNVADFVGEGVLITGAVTAKDEVRTCLGTLKGNFSYPCSDGCSAEVLIRPEDIVHDDYSEFKGEIVKKQYRGANIMYTLQLPSKEKVLTLVPSHHNHQIGQKIGIKAEVKDIILFEKRYVDINSELVLNNR